MIQAVGRVFATWTNSVTPPLARAFHVLNNERARISFGTPQVVLWSTAVGTVGCRLWCPSQVTHDQSTVTSHNNTNDTPIFTSPAPETPKRNTRQIPSPLSPVPIGRPCPENRLGRAQPHSGSVTCNHRLASTSYGPRGPRHHHHPQAVATTTNYHACNSTRHPCSHRAPR